MRQREAEELPVIQRLLREDRYEPQPVRRVWIEKPGSREKRPLGIPTVRDRIVRQSLRAVIEPILERDFSDQSHGFRPGRSARAAVARVEEQLEAGKTWVVDADIKGYFDNIPQDQLLALVKHKTSDKRMLGKFLRQGVMEGMNGWQPTASGTPQGAMTSPLLANIYLDQWIRMRLRSILRKRDKRKGRGRGRDHNRYQNGWFAERGLVFLITITHDSAASPTK